MEQQQSSASMGTSTSSAPRHTNTTQTILRIKRRRTETPVPCLRLEGVAPSIPQQINGSTLDLEEENYHHSPPQQRLSKKRSSAVLWKRFDPEMKESSTVSAAANRYRIVNAMFDKQEPLQEHTLQGRFKRRKLTVLNTDEYGDFTTDATTTVTSPLHSLFQTNNNNSPKKKMKHPLKILDPLTRIIDDSLQLVLAGSKTIQSHFLLLTTDPRFTLQDVTMQRTWIAWCHSSGGGNLLHCCALWNDPTTAHQLLQYCTARFHGSSSDKSMQEILVETTDGDGRTPYEVARVVGHEQVCQVLEAYGGDTTNYVYDIFYLDQENDMDEPMTRTNAVDSREFRDSPVLEYDDDGNLPMMTVELTSGVGYWTPEGELVLEADERNARSLSHETDGDIDSNCEEYGANDYPDEEEEGFGNDVVGSARRWMDQMAYSDYNENQHPDVDDGYDDHHPGFDEETGMFLQANDNYDEYDWEDDLGDIRQHATHHPYEFEDDE
jgi:hypothetical protein